MKLFWVIFISLSVESLLGNLSAYAAILEQEMKQTETEISRVSMVNSGAEKFLSVSQEASDLADPKSDPNALVISSVPEVSTNRVPLPSRFLTQNNDPTIKAQSEITLPPLQAQPLLPVPKPSESKPSIVPVEFGVVSPENCFNIMSGQFSDSNLYLDSNLNLDDVKFSQESSEQVLKANAQYKKIPQVIDKNVLPPFFTTVSLNGTLISHLSKGQVSAGYEFGTGVDDNFLINGLYVLKSQIKQSLSRDNVFTSDQKGLYLQTQTVRDNRTISITRTDPKTLSGLQFQLSFTGSCSAIGRFDLDPAIQCSLTPSLTTDRSSIDPSTLQPTRILQQGKFGDVVTPETLEILSQTGFQNIGANGQVVGLNLYFPNTGAFAGNSQNNRSTLTRFEDLDNTYTLGLYRLRQVYKANAEKAVLGRTLKGFTGILFDRNFSMNIAAQGAAQLFPDFVPYLKGDSNKPAITNLNQSLIFSANNTRIPERSFVVYQVGYGEAKHAKKNQKYEPGATFNSLWLGLTPVADRRFSMKSRYVVTSPSRVVAFAGAEGGSGSAVTPPSVLSLVGFDDTTNAIASSNLSSFYTQSYATFFETEVDRITKSRLNEKFIYYPHISITGNITNFNKVLRYYGGIITAPNPKAYIGVDYSHDLQKGLRISSSLIGYINPDRDYFSKAESRIEKVFRFSRSSSLSLFGNLRYVFDRIQNFKDGLYSNPVDNVVSIGLIGRIGPFSAGITQFLDLLPSSAPNGTGFNLSVDLAGRGRLSGYFLPQRGVTNYGVLALLKLNRSPNAPSLSMSWNRAIFDFGTDAFDNSLEATEDRFQFLLSFGSPDNPFQVNRQSLQ